jgi:predicted homoserine dehydrogenase-like protein
MAFHPSPFPLRVGISGTGFIARGFKALSRNFKDMRVTAVLTRRHPLSVEGIARDLLVRDPEELVSRCDLVLECTGDVIRATEVVDAAFRANLPVVTMNSEFHVTTGSWFAGRGILSEAEGDQPGSLAALAEEVSGMGFRPVVYGNTKRFLNPNPSAEEMEFWAAKQGISLEQVTAFTDGTKVHVEQAFVANGTGAQLPTGGLRGPSAASLQEGADVLAGYISEGGAIADFLVTNDAPGSVFIGATHDGSHVDALRYMKLGNGPVHVFTRPFHLCYFEIAKTIRRIAFQHLPPLLSNGLVPRYGIAAVAKRTLEAGERLPRGLGSFAVRGEAVELSEHLGHCPIGLLQNAVLRRKIRPGEILGMDDVVLPESLALQAWAEIESRVRATGRMKALPIADFAPVLP